MKKCTKCLVVKEPQMFHKKDGAKDGLFQWCIECHRVITKTRYAERRKDENFVAYERTRIRQWVASNFEKHRESSRLYAKNNPARVAAKVKLSRLGKSKRTPIWLTDDDKWLMEQAYELAALRTKTFGFEWHVDHVVPLHGKNVSGLHVPTNLQVIPAKQNRSKSNFFEIS
jgi:hypothetical protein